MLGMLCRFDASIEKGSQSGAVCDFNRSTPSTIDKNRLALLTRYGPIFWDILNVVLCKLPFLKKHFDNVRTVEDVEKSMQGTW